MKKGQKYDLGEGKNLKIKEEVAIKRFEGLLNIIQPISPWNIYGSNKEEFVNDLINTIEIVRGHYNQTANELGELSKILKNKGLEAASQYYENLKNKEGQNK